MKDLRHLNKYFYKYRYRLLLGFLFVSVSNVFGILPAQVIRNAFDLIRADLAIYHAFAGVELQQATYGLFGEVLLFFGALVLVLAVLKGFFMFWMRQTIIVMSRLVEYDLKNELYDHFQRLSYSFYLRNRTGDLMTRITEDVSRVRMYLGPAVMYSIHLLMLFIMVVSTMLYVNPTLTLYVLLPLPVLSISIYYVSHIINRKSEVIQRQLAHLNTMAQEVFSGIRVVKSYAREPNTAHHFEEECETYKEKSMSLARVEALFFPLMLLLIGLSTILTVFVGGIQVMNGAITTGNIAEFVIYINMLTWPVTALGWVASLVQRANASQKRINDFMLTPTEIKSGTVRQPVKGKIVFDKVHFTYPDTGVTALKDISCSINVGEKVAVVGRTGDGKSTLAHLLLRIFDPSRGQVRIDNTDLRKYDLAHLRKHIGFVPQETFLFSDTIANNIAFGVKEADEARIEQAAAQAGLLTDVQELPHGLQTMVGERGIALSGGQKQRVAIARAIIKDPRILVFDDCLSAVDARTEKLIRKNLTTLLEGRTALIITHRILSVQHFVDRTIVLRDGRITETGTHEALLRKQGYYRTIYEHQKLSETMA